MMIESKIKIYYMSTQTQNDLIHKINGTSNQYTTTLPHFCHFIESILKKHSFTVCTQRSSVVVVSVVLRLVSLFLSLLIAHISPFS